ncbi:hypothetical protein Tco_0682436 [Tanacetum coccineum]|uniref:Uncharacterized protein n=1 Tax=Tanacetum coccineum TaxID=301880 RepID=A0ABQ4XRR0_9ASTR
MDNSKRGRIPMQERLDLNKTQGASTPKEVKRMQNVLYASAVGIHYVCCELHWTAVKNILKYLRNTKDMFLVYGGNPKAELRVDCYCNAGFETDIDDMKSLTEYPLPPAPEPVAEPDIVAQWTALYDAHTEIAYERICGATGSLGYYVHWNLQFGIILMALLRFCGFVGKYNMHNMGKTIGNWKRNCTVLSCLVAEKRKQVWLCQFFVDRKEKLETGVGALYCTWAMVFRAQVEAIGSFDLVLPNGLVICLDNCHYAPTITRGVVSVSRLVDNGFVQCFTDCGISVSKNGVLYFNAVPRNESATRILNMVPTKKVDKHYELWYGKVPNLSYLKVYVNSLRSRLIIKKSVARAVDLEEIQEKKIQHLLKLLAPSSRGGGFWKHPEE